MNVFIAGSNGELGQALATTTPDNVNIISQDLGTVETSNLPAHLIVALGRRPQVILSASAYGHFATVAREVGVQLAYVSIDFVFNGLSDAPYPSTPPAAPLSTKFSREEPTGQDALIMRAAKVYELCTNNAAADGRAPIGPCRRRPDRHIHVCTWLCRRIADDGGQRVIGRSPLYQFRSIKLVQFRSSCSRGRTGGWSAGQSGAPSSDHDFGALYIKSPPTLLGARQIVDFPLPHWRTNLQKMITEIRSHG